MTMVSVVTTAASLGGSIGSGWSAWSKGWWPPGAACYIRQMNRVNSRSGSALLRWQHHKHCHGYYCYYYYYFYVSTSAGLKQATMIRLQLNQ